MARTKQTARKSTGRKVPRAPRGGAGEVNVGPDYDQDYDDFNKDILGDGDSDSEDDGYDIKKFKGRRDDDEEQQQGNEPYMLFDFRKGKDCFPENVDLIDAKRAENLLEKATAAAEEAAKMKKKDGEEDDAGKDKKTADTGTTGGYSSYSSTTAWGESKGGEETATDNDDNGIGDAVFETLKDGSTALIIKPGYRLRLKLADLLEGGDEKKEERKKNAEKEKKRKDKKKAKYSNYDAWPDMDDGWGDKKYGSSKWFKEYINSYTITMDIKILEEIPREGIALYQTALIHCEENKRSGKTALTRSDGECIVNQAGGVGMFGTYGDTTRARIEVGCWRRIVVTVNCAGSSGEKGEMRTWIGTEAGVVLKEESIVANERFALDPDGLYIFSSAQASMMPGNIAVRTIRIESKFSTDQDVKTNRARDKLLSRYDEERRAEVQEQRKGLSLAELFPKPRPMWATPSLVGLFGDAFVEKTVLEASSNLAWSYTVLNHALQKMIRQQILIHEGSGLDSRARTSLSDTLHVMQQSAVIFKSMLKMLKTPTESQLLSFLRKLKKNLNGLNQGESMLLPLLVESSELLLLIERTTERVFRFVVIQTDVKGLKNHSVSASDSAPKIKYRTCLVLNGIPKKNALDDVFWVAVYNLAVNSHQGDTIKFYDVLLPFLTGKPLEESLVDAENAALAQEESSLGNYGPWRYPQRSQTAYVRCVIEAMHFMLRRRGVSELQCQLIHLGLCYQMVDMVKNDLIYMLPDESGRRVCALAIRELSHHALKVVESAEKENDVAIDTTFILDEIHRMVQDVSASLEYCKDDSVDTPPLLDLIGTNSTDPEDPALTQFRHMLAWDIAGSDPDPGQAVSLQKYIPIDFLQIPRKASTRKEAITAIRMCDRICTLIENQSHCIKNDKFLILAVIEHLFTQVLPVPKPRAVSMTEDEVKTSERSVRRHALKAAEEAAKAEEKARKLAEKRANDPKTKLKREEPDEDQTTIVEKVECFGEELEPDFSVGKEAEKLLTQQECVWDGSITYELQVELLLTLQRLSEHFAAAAMSIQQSRPFDAVCIVVPGCICAISDAIMRKIAVDEPSVVCCHLMGRTADGRQLGLSGFGLSVGSFATQSETIEVHYPELSVARTAVLDYFQSPSQIRLEKIFSWEEEYVLKPGKNLIKYLRMVGKEIALPIMRPYAQLCDSHPISSHLIKNFPELKCYRDVAFWWKYFLNTDRKIFPNYSDPESPRDIARVDRMSAQLSFSWDDSAGGFEVTALGASLKCRPDPRQVNPLTGKPIDPQHLPTHRFPSTATPSFYVPLPPIKTEDDVIYRPNLPSFEDSYGQVLNQRDSELLISYLTVPYMRLPLLITFFSSEDRIHKLQCLALRQILDSVMFEPGKYLAMDMGGVEPLMVPTLHPELLATAYGLLMNELYRSPDTVIRSILTLLKGALAVDTGSVVDEGAKDFNTSTMIILYITRLGCRVDNYLTFLIDWAKGKHDCIDAPLREIEISPETLKILESGLTSLRELMHTHFENLFEDYLQRLHKQTTNDPNNETLIDRNSRLACDLHSHKLLMYRNLHENELTPQAAKTLIGSFVYLTTRHTWNKATSEGARLQMPETELYELLQVQRRRLIKWATLCKQGVVDEVMQTALQVSSSLTGSLKTSAAILDNQNRWSKIQGKRSVGRWAVGSTRTAVGTTSSTNDSELDLDSLPGLPQLKLQTSYNAEVGEVADTGMLGVEIDVQLGQMTLRSKHLAALESEIANHPDVTMIFGDSTIQASLIEKAEYRQCYRLVGLNHELQYWPAPHTVCPPLGDEWEREYDPAELFDSERWIVNLFEPVRKCFYDGPNPPPMQFMMPEKALPEDAEVAVLLGLHQKIGGPWKLVYLFRRLRCLHVYECVSQGREWWFSLHLTTDARYCLREMQPSWQNRQSQYPDWWINAGGNPYPSGCNDYLINDIDGNSSNPASSILVVRDQQHHLNFSGGREVLVPSRLLYGVIPEALLDAYIFWQDESVVPQGTVIDQYETAMRGYKRIRGYPKEEDGEYIVFIEFNSIGSFENHFPSQRRNNGLVIQATGLPGRTVTVTRRPKKLVEEEFRFRQQIAAACESTHLLIRPQKKKEVEIEADIDGELLFKVDAAVECDYEGKGEYWPCVIRRVNDNGTYDIEYVGDYKWVGIQRGVDPEIVQKRGENDKKARGEGVWHWDGMSESEDDDFRYESDEDDGKDDNEERKPKDRIDFFQFDQLYKVIEASGRNLDACLAALHRLASVPGVMPFTDVDKLASAVQYEITHGNFSSYGKSMSPFDSEDMFLLNLLYAPRRSRLFSVLRTLARIENASHICAWTAAKNIDFSKSEGLPFGCPAIDLIELPRLKLSFTARPDHQGILRLYSVDHVDIYITNERNSLTSKMLAGIPHSLLLSNVRGETQVLVPVIPPYRPFIGAEPFSTFIVLNRKSIPLSERFFLYPVHVSLSFLLTKGLNSAIYLMLLRFLHRDYDEVFRLADSIATDTSFNSEGNDIFQGFSRTNDDWHPDAHSCRLKISLVTIDSGTPSPWDLTIECARHIVKLDSVTSSCRLAPEEELQLLESDFVVTSTDSPKYDEKIHDEYSMALCYNRQHQLRAQMEMRKKSSNDSVIVPCKVPPRTLLTNWPYYQDNTVFGENYAQMVEIVSANEGDLSWTNQVTGGDDVDAPPGGWLVVACFHTLWSTGCVKVMPAVTELVPLYQDMATFLTVRADCHGMASISKSLNVTTFPSFLFFRGGVEVDRIVGHERVIEKLVRTLGVHIRDTDKMAHSKRKHRLRLERALEAGLQGPLEEETEEQGELEWTWDQEQCGESMRIEKEGMFVVLRDNEDDDDPIQWEYSRNNRSDWKEFSPETSKGLERAYKAGQIYRDGYANVGEISIWPHNVDIGTYEVSGFYCNWNTTGDSAYVRRRGDRLQVPHEENYLSKEQKERDERSAEWRARLAAYKKKLREERYGNDIEAIKGSVGMLPNTGVHTWTMRWNHEPARRGAADGFGICGDGCETFGPMPMPCLGGSEDIGASLALYANGLLYHNGKIIHTELGSRNIPLIEENKESPNVDEEIQTNEPKKKKKQKDVAPKVVDVKIEDRAPLFGKKSLVTCILDTGTNGGCLKFMIDKVMLNFEISQVYSLLGATELFPAICLCPYDHVEEDPLNPSLEQSQQQETTQDEPVDEEEFYDEDGNYDEEAANAAIAAEAKAAELAAAEALQATEELGKEPSVTLLPPGWEEEEQRQKEAALAAEAAAKAQTEALATANQVTIPLHDHPLTLTMADGTVWACNSQLSDGCKRSTDELSNCSRYCCAGCNFTICDLCTTQYLTDSSVSPTPHNDAPSDQPEIPLPAENMEVQAEAVDTPIEQGTASIEVEIPMHRIRWMWESESGWQVYSKEVSRELEQAVRDGKSNYTVTIGSNSQKCNLEAKVMLDDRDGNNRRLRRHVIGEGVAELWELLTMKYEKPMGLSGQGFLKILEKVWGGAETMDGKQAGLGFLFLYSLLSGESRAKAISSGYGGYGGYGPSMAGGYMMYGGKGGYSAYGKKGSSSSSDSHRFALLLTQLFTDRHTKSLPASIVNVLGRNRQVCLRMPRFKDTRKAMTTAFFNGWVDESEPRSPLGELFAKIIPQMRTMKRKAAFHFPPPPPHVELTPPLDKYTLLSSEGPTDTNLFEWERPELSDYGCECRKLESVDSQTVSNLASMVHYRLGQDLLRPVPPIKVDDAAHFSKIIRENPSRLFVVDFYATWCGPCKALAPVFRQLALRTPTALFLKVDIDDCDDLASAFKIEKMPTVKFMRGGVSPSNVVAEIQGGGPQFLVEFSKLLNTLSKPAELNLLRKFLMNSPGENIETVLKNMASTDDQVRTLATQPLEEFNSFIMMKTRKEIGMEDVDRNLAFDVTGHEASKTAVAHSVLSRIKDDVAAFADTANHAPVTKMVQLSDLDVRNFFAGVDDSEKLMIEAHRLLKNLIQKLYQLRDSDSQMVEDTIPLLERASNWVNVDEEVDPILRKSKTKFCLKRAAGINSNVWIEFLFGVLISSRGEEDLLRLNPYLSSTTIQEMLNLVTISMLRSNRLGHTNRCIGIAINLESLLQKILKIPKDQRAVQGPILMPKLLQSGEELSKNIAMARHYITENSTGLRFDPRYLVFEFVWNIQLRQKQVEIVDNFRENLKHGVSKVKQMIMGAGKTSVVAPLLALILADGKSLVLSVVPKALVEMSRTRMRETFAAIMVKRIYTLDFDRSTTVRPAMRRSLENAARNRGVVVATPTTIKSIMLSYVEVLQHLKEAYTLGVKSKLEELKLQAEELAKILSLFREGVMLLDEVDLILHPLKSELNFPIGDKFDLDGSEEGERWNLPIHLLDAIFYTQTGQVSTFENRGLAVDILKRLSNSVQQGVAARNLQMLPHITLLNNEFYHESMKPILAEWAYLWLQKQHLHGIDRGEAVRYMLEGAAARSDNSTKVNLIELALTKALVDSGDLPPIPVPTLGYQKSMTEAERVRSDSELKMMKEQASSAFNADIEYHDFTLSQISNLESAKAVALEHQKLVNEVYDLDEQIEEHVSNGGRKLGEIQGQIFALHKKISELECPRDDSLDNSVIVWLSHAFASLATAGATPASATPGESSVPAICNVLEDRGYTIRRCSDIEEAIARARDLQSEGHLRCVIVGGDEQGAGCGPTCVKNHSTSCLRCGQGFYRHSGHTCSIGGRGSFLLEDSSSEKISMLKLVQNLTDIESPHARLHGALPASRTAVYSAHTTIKEDDRMTFWKLGTTVTDESKQLISWVSSLPGWKDDVDGLDETKDEELDEDLPPVPALEKQSSSMIEKNELKKLRVQLEELESMKNNLTEDEESVRKNLIQRVAEKNRILEESVSLRIEHLTVAIKRFQALISQTGGSDDLDELKKLHIGPHCGRDSAIALSWLEVYGAKFDANPPTDRPTRLVINKHFTALNNELSFLKQMSLAAKVIAHVTSAMHKKLLNLCHNWLSTFLPHCLAKVNRVSFGLLSAEDCKAALAADPHVPRSRLKLAVPFVGKDVPSKSSEFAHPDVIIGLTILAYRYSGLRRDDYIDVVDSLTSQFSHEIGPARDRESNLRHERWVHAAGGAIRGLKCTKDGRPWTAPEGDSEKEVVQLKFLQKSNEEQMDKLYNLINLEPLVIHHYLQKTIFPLHMRSQRMKISASGQAVGGDMLVGRRVGFSGTPSDLLPQELGRCDYETGDDGMMLTTVLDRSVTSFEFLKDQWTVEKLLELIATAENPRFNALIDTGALITGYSNKEVAQQLLDRGLKWCEGVVFLDDDDKQQVLVRATGRVVSADQCGVPLERRFAFYDQIHTTGMDIKHVVNATAVITLGKDMVFRDYVQGAYRMRGIGAGQRIHVFIIPEVAELMKRELRDAVIPAHPQTNEHVLEDVVAWLIINSLRSEQIQWTMLCLQNIGNLYRKNAFQSLHRGTKYFMEGGTNPIESKDGAEETKVSASDTFIANLDKDKALAVFDEPIDFSLEAGVPDPVPFEERLRSMLDTHEAFLQPDQHAIGHRIMVVVGQFAMLESSANRLDTEQEREQEQEQEKEVEARRDKQIEVEKFVDREYSRQEEVQRPWPFSMLAKPIETEEHPFYLLKDFKLRHQEPLEFSDGLYLSTNYFNPKWTGLRRVKNVVMILEYAPSTLGDDLRLKTSEELQIQLSPEEEKALIKAHTLLGFEGMATGKPHHLTRRDLSNAIYAATDSVPSEEQLNQLIEIFSSDKKYLNFEEFKALMTSGILHPEHKGRNWVAVSLAEAETIRRIIHIRQKLKDNQIQPLINNATTEIALRYSPMNGPTAPLAGDGGVILDSSTNWRRNGTTATVYEAAKAHNSFRFFDCDMHYAPSALNVLIRSVYGSVYDRERFFHATVGCRRRMERKWQETPLARLFMVPHQWLALKQSAQAIFFREALKEKNLTLWEAFTAFDYNNSGMLSPSEFYGALVWLGVPDLTPDDVADFIEAADKNRDGIVDYREYMDMLSDPLVAKDEDEVVEEQDEDRVPIAKVEPYGADELREVMIHRKQAEIMRQKEERLRRQAYKDALDVKVFEEELEASKRRKGGANPLVYTEECFPGAESSTVTITDFKFSSNEFPLRLAPTGKCSFMTSMLHTSAYPILRPMTCPSKHPLGACYYSWMNCAICKKRRTHYYCTRWCSYYVCTSCYDSDRKIREIEKRDPAKNPTYLKCSNSCSFTLQIPSAGGLGGTNCPNFTVLLEVRFEKLPPKGHLQSLLRFSLPDIAQSRRLHRTSVYLNGDGVVLGRASGKGGLADGGQVVKPGLWQIISVSVKPEEGEMTTYVNGKLCHTATGLDPADLRLHHKLVILGGGRQAHSRGGDIRRVVIYSSFLDAQGCERAFFKLAQDNPSIGVRILLVQSLFRGYIARKKLIEEGIPIKKLSAGPQFVPPPQDYY